MERTTQKNGLVNLVVAGLVLAAALAAATLVQSLAGFTAAVFLLLGALVSFVSWFQMRLEENERNEKLELDELAASRGASLFEAKDGGSFPARNAREQFEKYIVPAFAIFLLVIEILAAWLIWRHTAKNPVTVINANATASLSLFAIFALVLFLFGRFSVTIARLEKHRLLQPGASYLLAGAYVCAVVALGIAGVEAKHLHADFWMARALCVLLALLAVENVLTLLLEVYRPRVKGKIARPLYDSRVAGLLAQPESLFTTAAQTLDYQFGFKVSETWIFQSLRKNLPAFLLIQLTVLIVSTMFVFVGAGEQVVLEHCGKPAAVFGPGAHLKLPWPIDHAYRFRTDQIQSFAVGYTPDTNDLPIVLWTVAHSKEENFLIGNHAALQSDTGTNAQPVALVTVSIPVQFQIVNVTNWIYQNTAPDALLQNLATREVVHYLAGSDMNELLSHGRLAAADSLRQKIQASADDRSLGVKIIFVGLQDIHPPTEKDVAATYEQVVSAQEKTNTTILNAQSAAIATNATAEARAYSLTNLADAARIRAQTQAFARAAAFTNQIPAFAAAPAIYRQRQLMQAFAESTKKARKYVLLSTNTSNVIWFDLEDKVNASLDQLVITNTP
jgi:regulator of protease activity HflC (stomatin/prohibitin superfamily)